jgi:hypothetical protein
MADIRIHDTEMKVAPLNMISEIMYGTELPKNMHLFKVTLLCRINQENGVFIK